MGARLLDSKYSTAEYFQLAEWYFLLVGSRLKESLFYIDKVKFD